MHSYYGHVQRFLLVVRGGKFAKLARELVKRVFSNSESYLLRRDLTVPFQAQAPKQPIEVRPINDSDIPAILSARPGRLLILKADIPTCYLGITASGRISYMQWLIRQADLERFRPFFDTPTSLQRWLSISFRVKSRLKPD